MIIGGCAGTHLILRSRAKRGVSKDGNESCYGSPFETRPAAAPQGEVVGIGHFHP
jgi:hypothetical protein